MCPIDREHAAHAIRNSYAILRKESDLSPHNAHITHTLTHLVHILKHCHAPETSSHLLEREDLSDARQHLPTLCGTAEGEMEKYWARKILADKHGSLEKFWYYSEYCALCNAETSLIGKQSFNSVSFLGSGALPVTAFLLARNLPETKKIICIDFDKQACELSEKLVRKLNLADRVSVQCMDALKYVPEKNELVVCASLLQGRQDVYQRLERHNCALMVRDAEGAYQFLYKAAELPQSGFREVAKTAVDPSRINTTRYYEIEKA